jgi:hypothetical protein
MQQEYQTFYLVGLCGELPFDPELNTEIRDGQSTEGNIGAKLINSAKKQN